MNKAQDFALCPGPKARADVIGVDGIRKGL